MRSKLFNKNKNYVKLKKTTLLLIIILTVPFLSSCNSKSTLSKEFREEVLKAVNGRVEDDKGIADEMVRIGILSQEDSDNIKKHMDEQVNSIKNKGSNEALINYLSTATTFFQTGGDNLPHQIEVKEDSGGTTTLEFFAVGAIYEVGGKSWECDRAGWYSFTISYDANGNVTGIAPKDKIFQDLTEKDITNQEAPTAFIMGNYLASEQFKTATRIGHDQHNHVYIDENDAGVISNLGSITGAKGGIDKLVLNADKQPINLVGDGVERLVNEDLSRIQVYVLKADISDTGKDNSLDAVLDVIKQYCDVSETRESLNVDSRTLNALNTYFAPAKDEKGNYVYLIDPENDNWNLIENTHPWDGEDSSKDKPGYDLVIGQDTLKNCMHLRLKEFSKDASDLYTLLLDNGNQRYYITKNIDQGGTRAYLMEYPVQVIDSMQDSDDSKSVECNLKKSGLGVNLLTRNFCKYKWDESAKDWDYSQVDYVSESFQGDYYLNLDVSEQVTSEANSSIVLRGYDVIPINIIGKKGKSAVVNDTYEEKAVLTGRLVLRDYLEATYAPDFQQDQTKSGYGEKEVLFGRKIRFDMSNPQWVKDDNELNIKYKGTEYKQTGKKQWNLRYKKKNADAAYFVDQSGQRVKSSPALNILEFADIDELMDSGDNTLYTIASEQEKGGDAHTKSDSDNDGKFAINELASYRVKNGESDHNTNYSIHTTDYFPGNNIGKLDFEDDNEDKQRLYVIATKSGLINTSLYSSWINSNSTTASLNWWNGYLSKNGYDYTIDHSVVNQYTNANYKYDPNADGIYVADLDTLVTISDMYKQDSQDYIKGVIITIFKIIGWLAIIYATILMLLWNIDVNNSIGVQLVEKFTLGHCVAIKYEEDIPAETENGQRYLTLKRLIVFMVVIVCMGFILIYLNPFIIIKKLVETFGLIAKQLEAIILGLKDVQPTE